MGWGQKEREERDLNGLCPVQAGGPGKPRPVEKTE